MSAKVGILAATRDQLSQWGRKGNTVSDRGRWRKPRPKRYQSNGSTVDKLNRNAEILRAYRADGVTQAELARRFGLSSGRVSQIITAELRKLS